MKINISNLKNKIAKSKLLNDSFWAVFGNGLGNFLLLIAGIVIARILGKDLYGEYGMVKTTMFHIASFSTIGLGFTSTKYIADAISNNPVKLKQIIRTALGTTFAFSFFLCVLLFAFAEDLANFIEEPGMAPAFRALGIVVIFRAINTICAGILAGYKSFRTVGINSAISGATLLACASILTFKFGLLGSFIALALSQFVNALLNFIATLNQYNKEGNTNKDYTVSKEMLSFTVPVAIQEFFYLLSTWGGTLILTKYASLGDVGVWSAALQWNAIITFVPHLLVNVVISHLSGLSKNKASHTNMLKKMLLINFVCSFIPFVIVFIFGGFIATFYGPTFVGLEGVIRVLTFSAVITCFSNVFHSSLLSEGRNWLLLAFRAIRDVLMLSILWLMLRYGVSNAAMAYAWIYVMVYALYLILLVASEVHYKTRTD